MNRKTETTAYSKLPPKRQRFVDAYFECKFNAKQAAISAGYSAKTAENQAARLLSFVKVKAAIEERRAVTAEETKLKISEVVNELRKIGFTDITQVVEWSNNSITIKNSADIPPEVRACIAEISETQGKFGSTIKVKFHNKVAALELLGRYLAMFTDKHEHTGKDGDAIEVKTEHNLSKLSKEELRQLLALVEKAGHK